MLRSQPHFGESKWLALSASARALKAFLVSRRERGFHTHQLAELAAEAERLGLVRIPTDWVRAIQCEEGVRGSPDAVSLDDAAAAYECALRIAGHAVAGVRRGG
jgi:hypothetical protein